MIENPRRKAGPKVVPKEFYEFLAERAKEVKQSQAALALALGICRDAAIKILHGEQVPTASQLEKLCRNLALGRSEADRLFMLIGKMPPDIQAKIKQAGPEIFRKIREL